MGKLRKTILNDEQYLRQISQEVDFSDKSYLDDIEKLREFCQTDGIFALAPVQIGIPKRIIYLRSTNTDLNKTYDSNYDENRILINPVIIRREGLTKFLEACASCPDISASSEEFDNKDNYLSCIVERPYLIEVEYYDVDGNKKTQIFKGFESTVFSHEYDHLNGVLHIDLASDIWPMNGNQRIEYRNKRPYQVISEDCDFDKEVAKNQSQNIR